MSEFSKSSKPARVFPENKDETAPLEAKVFRGNRPQPVDLEPCGAKTRSGARCAELVPVGRRCRSHGGASTGPRTIEGRGRISEATRARYIANALARGWVMPPEELRARVRALKLALHGSQNATARVLGITWSGVRRMLTGLPLRPEEAVRIAQSSEFPSSAAKSLLAGDQAVRG